MKVLKIKDWVKAKENIQFEFVSTYVVHRLVDKMHFTLGPQKCSNDNFAISIVEFCPDRIYVLIHFRYRDYPFISKFVEINSIKLSPNYDAINFIDDLEIIAHINFMDSIEPDANFIKRVCTPPTQHCELLTSGKVS